MQPFLIGKSMISITLLCDTVLLLLLLLLLLHRLNDRASSFN